ncbi:MAG: DnaJ domain-containing protein [Oligoflexia bacterium]|nr:DnaJ domain-containing protein [Oligoflexia bacterium]
MPNIFELVMKKQEYFIFLIISIATSGYFFLKIARSLTHDLYERFYSKSNKYDIDEKNFQQMVENAKSSVRSTCASRASDQQEIQGEHQESQLIKDLKWGQGKLIEELKMNVLSMLKIAPSKAAEVIDARDFNSIISKSVSDPLFIQLEKQNGLEQLNPILLGVSALTLLIHESVNAAKASAPLLENLAQSWQQPVSEVLLGLSIIIKLYQGHSPKDIATQVISALIEQKNLPREKNLPTTASAIALLLLKKELSSPSKCALITKLHNCCNTIQTLALSRRNKKEKWPSWPDLIHSYKILDEVPGAPLEKVKKKYNQMVMRYHPDRLASEAKAEEMSRLNQKLIDINNAYAIVGKFEEKRTVVQKFLLQL